jgi:CHRD domain-containing protein
MSPRKLFVALVLVTLATPAVLLTGAMATSGAQTGPKYKPAFASMLGANEIDADGKKGAGDEDGEGSFALTGGSTTICFAYVVKSIETPVAAHIHKAKAGKNGDVVVPLTPIPDAGDPGTTSGCVQDLDAALVEDIVEHPTKYYANVHTADFPDGAIRGQLQQLPKKV